VCTTKKGGTPANNITSIHNQYHDDDERKRKTPGDKRKIHKDYHKGCDDVYDDGASIVLCTISYTFLAFVFHSDDTFSCDDTYDVTFLDHMVVDAVVYNDALVVDMVLDMAVDVVVDTVVDMVVFVLVS
jgi:hypothetical protein